MTSRCSAARTRTLTTSATGLLLGLALVGCATTPSIYASPPPQHGEVLHASPMTIETMEWLTEVQTNLDGDGSGLEFGIVELPWGLTEDDVASLIADSLERPDIPITVTVTGAVRPADA